MPERLVALAERESSQGDPSSAAAEVRLCRLDGLIEALAEDVVIRRVVELSRELTELSVRERRQVSFDEAYEYLASACAMESAAPVHPGAGGSLPFVEILTPRQATGRSFAHLWILGMRDTDWPPPVRPNPLVDLGILRKRAPELFDRETSAAGAERDLLALMRETERRGSLRVSYAVRDAGAERLFSNTETLHALHASDYGADTQDDEDHSAEFGDGSMQYRRLDSVDRTPLEWQSSPEDVLFHPACAIEEARRLGHTPDDLSGESLNADVKPEREETLCKNAEYATQFECPFRAFAIHRLGIKPPARKFGSPGIRESAEELEAFSNYVRRNFRGRHYPDEESRWGWLRGIAQSGADGLYTFEYRRKGEDSATRYVVDFALGVRDSYLPKDMRVKKRVPMTGIGKKTWNAFLDGNRLYPLRVLHWALTHERGAVPGYVADERLDRVRYVGHPNKSVEWSKVKADARNLIERARSDYNRGHMEPAPVGTRGSGDKNVASAVPDICKRCDYQSACRYNFADEPRVAESSTRRQTRERGTATVFSRKPTTPAAHAEDAEIRSTVTNPKGSFLVRAPAGSGKTQLLAERYLQLLRLPDVEPENIVCLTFTRKAAGEMRERVLELIAKTSDETITKYASARERNRVSAQTIDGFQRALARADTLRAGLLPHFKAADGLPHYRRAVGRRLKWQYRVYDDLRKAFSGAQVHRKMVDMLRKREQWLGRIDVRASADSAKRLLKILGTIAEHDLARTFAMECEYDFVEVSGAATRLVRELGGASGVEAILGYRIRHLLVDEFQDVSATQCEFLEGLVSGWKPEDGTSLFFVGDSMQSIYRFRGAGTKVILDLFDAGGERASSGGRVAQFGKQPLAVASLTMNFRSRKKLVDGIYDLLKREDRGARRSRRPGEALLVKSTAARDGNTGKFRLVTFEREDEEAAWIAGKMHEYRQCDRQLAVLVRARADYTRYIEPQLVDIEGIDVGFLPLHRQACVRDICTLGRCIENPEDELAALALLRSPLIGMSSAEIGQMYRWLEVMNRDNDEKSATPLEATLTMDPSEILRESELGAGGGERRRSGSIFAMREWERTWWKARVEMRRMPVRAWLERAWFRMGGGVVYSRREDMENVEQLLDMVEQRSGKRSHCDWRAVETALRSKPGVSRYPDAVVRVMTIHGAKGLEFENVIVPFVHRKPPSPKRDLVMLEEVRDGNGRRTYRGVVDGKEAAGLDPQGEGGNETGTDP